MHQINHMRAVTVSLKSPSALGNEVTLQANHTSPKLLFF